MIDFPNAPTTGQIYNSGTGPIYIWDGVAWSLVTQATRTARQNNLVVNPAMQVSQENGATAGSTNLYYAVDQWLQSLTTSVVCSFQQVASQTPDLSPNRVRKTVTTRKTSLTAAELIGVYQTLEGTRISCLGYGTPAAIQSVARFGFKGPAGTYSFSFQNYAGTRSYIKNFTISAGQANTDTLQTVIIPGDVAGAWVNDNSPAAYLTIYDAVGSTYIGVEGWQAGAAVGTAANSNMVATNGNVVELFDVGLYPDPEKTGLPPPFIAPIYAQALYDCERYYQIVGVSIGSYGIVGSGIQSQTSLRTIMRTGPTIGNGQYQQLQRQWFQLRHTRCPWSKWKNAGRSCLPATLGIRPLQL